MIHLLQPLWLGAMAAIAAPVILHFWNDRRGKVLRIGSISLLMGASQRMAWSRRLSQWLLLLLRCLLLILLAVLLAGPYWRRTGEGSHVRGWVLEDTGAAAGRGAVVDSLVKAGWERHILRDSLNYWNGLRAADTEAPAGVPFYVVTTGLLQRFSGERPSMARDIHWDTYTPADSVHDWIRAAWLSGPDSVRVLRGVSRSTGTQYSGEIVAAGSQLPVKVDTSVLRVAVSTASRQDGRYVVAALRALQQYTRRRIEVVEGKDSGMDTLMAGGGWNEAVWDGSLPVRMEKLLYGEDTDVAEDRRVIDPAQMLPAQGGRLGKAVADPGINLAPVVWWLILLLFIIERVVSHGKRKT